MSAQKPAELIEWLKSLPAGSVIFAADLDSPGVIDIGAALDGKEHPDTFGLEGKPDFDAPESEEILDAIESATETDGVVSLGAEAWNKIVEKLNQYEKGEG